MNNEKFKVGEFFTTSEVADALSVSTTTVRRLLKKHSIQVLRLGKKLKIPGAEVVRLLDEVNVVYGDLTGELNGK